jgi:DNA-binding response OmpR family regulator
MAKILLVEDDRHLANLTQTYLLEAGHQIDWADCGEKARAMLLTQNYDLFILDWMLPDITGLEICQRYRANGGTAPILLLTARASEEDKVAGLDSGADDYLVKPFGRQEFTARVRALLRRPSTYSGKVLQIEDLQLNATTQTVTRAGKLIDLRPKEYNLLEFLMRHQGQNFPAETLLERIWQSDSTTSIDTVRMHIMSLRRKLGDCEGDNSLIRNTRGRGYRINSNP